MASQFADTGVVLVGDKTASAHKPAAQPKLEYEPSAGDYREAQANAQRTLNESNTFLFQDMKLPENKDLLATFNAVATIMGDKPVAEAKFESGSVLALKKEDGRVTSAAFARVDGTVDMGTFDAKMNVTSEALQTPLGSRIRQYWPGTNVIKSESNSTANYSDTLEFDAKGKLFHSHVETGNDVKDDKRNPDGSGLFTETLKNDDPKQAFTETALTKADGSVVDDKKYGDGNFIHLELDKNGQATKLDKSDTQHGQIHHSVRQPDGTVKETTDLMA